MVSGQKNLQEKLHNHKYNLQYLVKSKVKFVNIKHKNYNRFEDFAEI